ncbi:hypothetical protein SH668x_001064 [Planctomicrobium sp. SH668]|uniref:hypothetical protein n=1 Tax=Planctomicrobium sp. SH668 TaxID=3448126 RepID=UPI003F5C9D1C
MTKLIKDFLADEGGFVLSAELVLLATVGVLGLTVMMVAVRDSIGGEMADLANSFRRIDQSYGYGGMVSRGPHNKIKSFTAGSGFLDEHLRERGSEQDIVVGDTLVSGLPCSTPVVTVPPVTTNTPPVAIPESEVPCEQTPCNEIPPVEVPCGEPCGEQIPTPIVEPIVTPCEQPCQELPAFPTGDMIESTGELRCDAIGYQPCDRPYRSQGGVFYQGPLSGYHSGTHFGGYSETEFRGHQSIAPIPEQLVPHHTPRLEAPVVTDFGISNQVIEQNVTPELHERRPTPSSDLPPASIHKVRIEEGYRYYPHFSQPYCARPAGPLQVW